MASIAPLRWLFARAFERESVGNRLSPEELSRTLASEGIPGRIAPEIGKRRGRRWPALEQISQHVHRIRLPEREGILATKKLLERVREKLTREA